MTTKEQQYHFLETINEQLLIKSDQLMDKVVKLTEENQRLREALERAIGTIDMECDDYELIAELKNALSNNQIKEDK